MKPGQCQICLMDEAGYIENKVLKNEMSYETGARELGVKLPDFVAHYELHIRNKLVTAIAKDKEIEVYKNNYKDKVFLAHESLDRLLMTTKQIHQLLLSEDNKKSTKLITAYAALEKNVITGLKEVAFLEGEINVASTINVQYNEIKFDKVMSIVLEHSTPIQQAHILKAIEDVQVPELNV